MHPRLLNLLLMILMLSAAVPSNAQQWRNANVKDNNQPAPIVRPLQAELPIVAAIPSASTITPTEAQLSPIGRASPAITVSAMEPLKPLPTEKQLREQARREAEARRPPPLVLQPRPQKIETLSDGNFLIMPQDTPLRANSTLAGSMFNDDTELSLPQKPSKSEIPPAPESLPSNLPPQPLTPPAPAAAATPAKLPASLTLVYTADITQLSPAQQAKLNAWARQLPVKAKITVLTYNEAPPLGASVEEIGAARWSKVQAVLKGYSPQLVTAGVTHHPALTVKGEQVQRLVLKVRN